MVSQLINEPGFISVEFSAREVWHIEREQIAFYKNIFTITSVVFAVAFTYWRLMRRYQQMQLNHILEELHLIAEGQYDRRIPFRLSGDMGQVVNSINRLVEFCTFFFGESGIIDIRFWIRQVDFLMRHVQVTTENHWFCLF